MTFRTCCHWLNDNLTCAGKHGISVVAIRAEDARRFQLQARPLNAEQLSVLGQLTAEKNLVIDRLYTAGGRSAPIKALMTVTMHFCPSCGSDLGALITSQETDFDALAAAHAMYRASTST